MTDIEIANLARITELSNRKGSVSLSDETWVSIYKLIYRQKQKIERLELLNKCYYTSLQQIAKSNHEIKAEAIKEFAERLKEETTERYEDIAYKDLFFGVIDNLVKEMVGDDQ